MQDSNKGNISLIQKQKSASTLSPVILYSMSEKLYIIHVIGIASSAYHFIIVHANKNGELTKKPNTNLCRCRSIAQLAQLSGNFEKKKKNTFSHLPAVTCIMTTCLSKPSVCERRHSLCPVILYIFNRSFGYETNNRSTNGSLRTLYSIL